MKVKNYDFKKAQGYSEWKKSPAGKLDRFLDMLGEYHNFRDKIYTGRGNIEEESYKSYLPEKEEYTDKKLKEALKEAENEEGLQRGIQGED